MGGKISKTFNRHHNHHSSSWSPPYTPATAAEGDVPPSSIDLTDKEQLQAILRDLYAHTGELVNILDSCDLPEEQQKKLWSQLNKVVPGFLKVITNYNKMVEGLVKEFEEQRDAGTGGTAQFVQEEPKAPTPLVSFASNKMTKEEFEASGKQATEEAVRKLYMDLMRTAGGAKNRKVIRQKFKEHHPEIVEKCASEVAELEVLEMEFLNQGKQNKGKGKAALKKPKPNKPGPGPMGDAGTAVVGGGDNLEVSDMDLVDLDEK